MNFKKNINMIKTGKNSLIIDFAWTFTGDLEQFEGEKKYKAFLKEMYISSKTSFLLLNKEEEEFLRNYK